MQNSDQTSQHINSQTSVASQPVKLSTEPEHWDIVIRKTPLLFTLRLRELWRQRDLLYLLVKRDLTTIYKQTLLGPLWLLLQPLFTTMVYVVVFGQIANLPTDDAPKYLFYLTGVTFWNYFADCLNKVATVFRDNAGLFNKVYFPRIIVPLSIAISNLARLGLQMSLLLALILFSQPYTRAHPSLAIISLPLIILDLALISLSIGMVFSAVTSKYRDLVFVLQFGVQLLMYATPIIYPTSHVPQNIAGALAWNPLAPLIENTRHAILGTGVFSLLELVYPTTFALVGFFLANIVFNHTEKTFIDTI